MSERTSGGSRRRRGETMRQSWKLRKRDTWVKKRVSFGFHEGSRGLNDVRLDLVRGV